MLVIRKEQLESLEDAAIRAFENRTYSHLQEYFLGHCRLLGENQMRRVIQYGWMKAKSYELTAECCVRSYIEFMCLLGCHFDTDALLPWAAEILNDRTTEQVARGDRLYDRAREHIKRLIPDYRDPAGKPITARFMTALRQLRHEPDAPFSANHLPTFSRALRARLESVFPAKYCYIGEQQVSELVAQAIATAAHYGMVGERGVTLFTVLMFVLGSGFHRDPLLPWASATLTDDATDEKKKVDKLYAEGVGFLRAWWNPALAHEA